MQDWADTAKRMSCCHDAIMEQVKPQAATVTEGLTGILTPCPACGKGELYWSWYKKNGYTSGTCSENCVSWIQ